MDLEQLRQELVECVSGAQAIRAPYAGKAATMTAEESTRFGALMDRADAIKAEMDGARKARDLDARLDGLVEWTQQADHTLRVSAGRGAGAEREERSVVANGVKTIKAAQGDRLIDLAITPRTRESRDAWKSFFRGDSYSDISPDAFKMLAEATKALYASDMTAGGALVVPMELSNQILATVKDMTVMRGLATVLPPLTKAESLGIPTLDTEPADPTWTSELDTGADDTIKPFGRRQLMPHALAKQLKISKKLLRIAAIDPEAFWIDRISYRVARTEDNAFLNGSGAQQPLGVFTGSADGIPATATYDTTCASSTVIAGDDLISCKHNMKVQYWPRAKWLMHRLVVAAVRKLKDSSGNYLWQPGLGGYVAQGTALIGGNPDTILDMPVVYSELAPSTFTTGLYLAVLADFSNYWIVDALDMQIQRLLELYAATNQIGFILRKESDGAPVLAESFQRLKLA